MFERFPHRIHSKRALSVAGFTFAIVALISWMRGETNSVKRIAKIDVSAGTQIVHWLWTMKVRQVTYDSSRMCVLVQMSIRNDEI